MRNNNSKSSFGKNKKSFSGKPSGGIRNLYGKGKGGRPAQSSAGSVRSASKSGSGKGRDYEDDYYDGNRKEYGNNSRNNANSPDNDRSGRKDYPDYDSRSRKSGFGIDDGRNAVYGDSSDNMIIEGRNAVIEALRSGTPVDKIYLQDGSHDGPLDNIRIEAKKRNVQVRYVDREELDYKSETGRHQGVIAMIAAYEYATVEDILLNAREKREDPFIVLLDSVEDPHNLGAIIRTANLAGAHGIIIPKNRAVGLTATVAKASAGALNYTPVAKVTNIAQTIEALKKQGMWFVCADMKGRKMYDQNLTGPIGLVVGGENSGVGENIKKKCDFTASIPMKGDINSLNVSVAAGVLMYEIVRQRML